MFFSFFYYSKNYIKKINQKSAAVTLLTIESQTHQRKKMYSKYKTLNSMFFQKCPLFACFLFIIRKHTRKKKHISIKFHHNLDNNKPNSFLVTAPLYKSREGECSRRRTASVVLLLLKASVVTINLPMFIFCHFENQNM